MGSREEKETGEMSDDDPLPGDRVRITEGTFAGYEGTIITPEEAKRICKKMGQQTLFTRWPPGSAYVLLTLFDRDVPIIMLREQMERILS